MYLSDNKENKIYKFKLQDSFLYWKNMLFEKCVRIFEWNGLPFPQKEIESRLLLRGFCGFVNDRKCGLMVAYGSMSGNTQYYDVFKNFTYSAPTAQGGMKEIGKSCVIIDNDTLRNGLIYLINRYALLLAHAEITQKMSLVNIRYKDILTSSDSNTAETIKRWYSELVDGKDSPILDEDILNSVTSQSKSNYNIDVRNIWELRNDILRSFFQEIGINYNKEKKERQIMGELVANENMLLLNVNDMLKCRRNACEEINAIFGTNISVEFNKDVILFDTEQKEETEETEDTEESEVINDNR